MAVYRVQGPDGAVHRFEGPDDATPEQVTAAAAQQFGQVDTAADSAARGLPPLQMQPQRGGYAAQVGQAMAQRGPNPQDQQQTGPQPLSMGLMGQRAGDAATGMISNLLGIPGDVQKSGIPGFVPPMPEGGPRLWTGSEIGNLMAGPPADEQAALTRNMAGMAGPSLALKAARLPGAVARGFSGATALPRNASAADKGLSFVQNIARQSGLTPEAIEQAANGKPLIGAEAMGPNAQTQLMAAARREGTSGPALNAAMSERAQGRSERVLEDMANSSGIHPEAAKGNIDALVTAGQEKAKPLFDQALGGSGPVWNADLARLAERPVIKEAISGAATDLRNADINPKAMGLEVDPMMGLTGAKQLQPTAQAWDLIRKRLNFGVERDPFGKIIPDSISPGNRNVNVSSRDLTGALKSAIPGYGDALNVSGDYLSSKAAFERGQSMILNPNVTEDQFAGAVAKLTHGEKEAMKGGAANKLFELAQNGRLNPKQFFTLRAQAKLQRLLGPDQARMFIGNLQKEAAMSAFEKRAITASGSQTAPLSQAMKEQDAFGQNPMLNDAVDALRRGPAAMARNVVGGAIMRKGQGAIDAMRTRGLGTEGRNEIGRLLMLPPEELAKALRVVPNLGPGALNNVGRAGGLDPRTLGMLSPQLLLGLLSAQSPGP